MEGRPSPPLTGESRSSDTKERLPPPGAAFLSVSLVNLSCCGAGMETCVYILLAGYDCKHAYVNISEHTYRTHVLPRSAHGIIQLEPGIFINSSKMMPTNTPIFPCIFAYSVSCISQLPNPPPPISLNPQETPRRPLT